MRELEANLIHTGDTFDVLPTRPEESVHSVVTDPPYGLAFMGKSWDDFEPKEYQEWCEEWAREVMRVLRPGGHLLAFSGNRTHHRLFTGVEDAGFEVRDTITWHYGSGFPKALDVSKAIDKQAGAEREVVGEKRTGPDMTGANYGNDNGERVAGKVTAPATDAAEKWDGFKTCLKPATEYIVVARKPLGEDTVAENVQEWGTGALNIGATRIDSGERPNRTQTNHDTGSKDVYGEYENDTSRADGVTTEGRYPANVVFHEDTDTENAPSRYFYTSKASKSERTESGQIQNDHPTVKPLDLMEWLVKLVTREGQTVLDPFAGSGTTCKAAKSVGREFIGIEEQAKYADIARVRCGLTPRDPSHVRGDDSQSGLEGWGE